MKKLIIALSVIGLLSGCSINNGEGLKNSLKVEYKVCQDEVDKLRLDRYYSTQEIVFIGIIISQCENTQKILEEIRKGK